MSVLSEKKGIRVLNPQDYFSARGERTKPYITIGKTSIFIPKVTVQKFDFKEGKLAIAFDDNMSILFKNVDGEQDGFKTVWNEKKKALYITNTKLCSELREVFSWTKKSVKLTVLPSVSDGWAVALTKSGT